MSAVVEAQDALVELVAGASAFEGIFQQLGIPFEIPRKTERLYVSEDVVGYRRSRGGDFVDESFGLIVVIEVWRSGAPAGPARTRTWDLIDALDRLLEAVDFYGHGSEDGQLLADLGVSGHENGRLAKAIITIPVTSLS